MGRRGRKVRRYRSQHSRGEVKKRGREGKGRAKGREGRMEDWKEKSNIKLSNKRSGARSRQFRIISIEISTTKCPVRNNGVSVSSLPKLSRLTCPFTLSSQAFQHKNPMLLCIIFILVYIDNYVPNDAEDNTSLFIKSRGIQH